MHKEQRVGDMASAVLTRQAEARVERTGESFEEALKAVLETEAGQQLRELRDGPHRDKEAERWQEERPQKRSKERKGDLLSYNPRYLQGLAQRGLVLGHDPV
ncbi:MAG: hypothetical protein M3315_11945, partial [Actinomycetota bacterium]|nr:hypothetical protein [Actinomycetota bacterium]